MPPILALLWSAALAISGVLSAAPLDLFYTANRQGEVDPCDCPGAAQNGGITRMGAFLDATRSGTSFFGDAGDTFFSVTSILPSRHDEELVHAHLIARAYQLMGLDVLTPGERDFALGIDTLKSLERESGARFVAANLVDGAGQPVFPPSVIVEKKGIKIGVVGIADPDAFKGAVKALPYQPVLAEEVRKLRDGGARLVVVLSHLGLPGDRKIAEGTPGIDVIFGAHSLDALSRAELVKGVRIVQPVYQGQQIGQLTYDPDKKKWSGDRLVDLGKEWERPGAVSRLLAQQKKAIHQAAVQTPDSEPAHGFVAHPNACRECHAKQYDFWETTKHASAYLVLFAKNQHFDAECIGCHSLGYRQPGGFSSIASPIRIAGAPKRKAGETPFIEKMMNEVFADDGPRRPLDSRQEPDRYAALKKKYHQRLHELEASRRIDHLYAGVQCEHCHGSLVGHPQNKIKIGKVPEKTCRTCHNSERSPEFRWAWRGLVACPH